MSYVHLAYVKHSRLSHVTECNSRSVHQSPELTSVYHCLWTLTFEHMRILSIQILTNWFIDVCSIIRILVCILICIGVCMDKQQLLIEPSSQTINSEFYLRNL